MSHGYLTWSAFKILLQFYRSDTFNLILVNYFFDRFQYSLLCKIITPKKSRNDTAKLRMQIGISTPQMKFCASLHHSGYSFGFKPTMDNIIRNKLINPVIPIDIIIALSILSICFNQKQPSPKSLFSAFYYCCISYIAARILFPKFKGIPP